MATYPPPSETLPIFDSGVFTTNDTTLTIAQADARYLKFPTGQGTETIPSLVVSAISTTFNASKLYTSDITYNTILNSSSGTTNYTGLFNAFFGREAGLSLTSGGTNAGFGEFETLKALTTGNSNTAMGSSALKAITTSSFNTAFGYNSGLLTTGSNNTFIGASADTTSAGASQCTALGYQSSCGASNTTALGHATIASGANSTAIGHNATTAGFARSTALGYNSAATAVDQISLGNTSQSYRLAGMYSNNYIHYRLATQSIPNSTNTTIIYNTIVNAGNCGIGYNSGTGVFTNNNAYSVVCSVSWTTIFTSNAVGTRVAWLETTGAQRYGNIEIGANASGPVGFTSSTNISLISGQTFRIFCSQSSGGALSLGVGTLLIPNEVSMLVW